MESILLQCTNSEHYFVGKDTIQLVGLRSLRRAMEGESSIKAGEEGREATNTPVQEKLRARNKAVSMGRGARRLLGVYVHRQGGSPHAPAELRSLLSCQPRVYCHLTITSPVLLPGSTSRNDVRMNKQAATSETHDNLV